MNTSYISRDSTATIKQFPKTRSKEIVPSTKNPLSGTVVGIYFPNASMS
jgi:hypothetical protein